MPMLDTKVQPELHGDRLNQLLYTLARAYLQREQYAAAYDKLKQLLELDPENAEILLDAAIAAMGLNEVSDEALELYARALQQNPTSKALKLNLADLFIKREVTSTFAIEVCEMAVEMSPPNEHQIHLFLKRYYEMVGQVDKAVAAEQRAIFTSRDTRTIRRYLESLWWEGRFAEARQVLLTLPRVNGSFLHFARELALTHAYELLSGSTPANEDQTLEILLATLPGLAPAASPLDLRDYLVVRVSLQHPALLAWLEQSPRGPALLETADVTVRQLLARAAAGESEAAFDMRRELLGVLAAAAGEADGGEGQGTAWESVLFAQLSTANDGPPPERLVKLMSAHLQQVADSVVRLSGPCVVSLAGQSAAQIRAAIDFMQNLEDYNLAVAEPQRVTLVAALHTGRFTAGEVDLETLSALVEASHLVRYGELAAKSEGGTGVLLVQAEEDELARLQRSGHNLVEVSVTGLLPRRDARCAEVIWRNPILQFKEGQVYEFGRYAVRQRLLKHSGYATFLATDLMFDRPVIMKIMLPQPAAEFQQEAAKREQLFQRLRAVGRLSHPYLAILHDIGEHEGMFYFTREYVEGRNLAELNIPEEQRDAEVLMLLQKIVRALKFGAGKGAAYLNLKPGNIWLSEAQELKITDFRIPGFTADSAHAGVLPPAQWRYQAPEILLEDSGDARSDVYSIGVIAYELLAGRHPYAGARDLAAPQDLLSVQIPPLSDAGRRHHRAWDGFVMRALNADPQLRFQSLEEMELELRNIQAEMLEKALNVMR